MAYSSSAVDNYTDSAPDYFWVTLNPDKQKQDNLFISYWIIFLEKSLFVQAGMQREIFEKLVSKLEHHCNTILIGSEIDYRRFIAQRSVNQVRICVISLLSFF